MTSHPTGQARLGGALTLTSWAVVAHGRLIVTLRWVRATATAPKRARSSSASCGRLLRRCSTPSWCRRTMISRSFERPLRTASRTSNAYADDGVRRFADPEWRYGKDVPTGAMVGYVESLTLEGIVTDVTRRSIDSRYQPLTLPRAAGDSLTEMEYSFKRPFEISPFRLVHFWIDIRPSRLQIRIRYHLRELFG